MWFAFTPLPPSDFDYTSVGVKAGWDHNFTGFFVHWNINTNPARHSIAGFSISLVGRAIYRQQRRLRDAQLHPDAGDDYSRPHRRHVDEGRSPTLGVARKAVFITGVLLLAAGYGMEVAGACPIVNRVWTPALALFSGCWCFLFLFLFSFLFDHGSKLRHLAFPLVVMDPQDARHTSRITKAILGLQDLLGFRLNVRVDRQRRDRHCDLLAGIVADVQEADLDSHSMLPILWNRPEV